MKECSFPSVSHRPIHQIEKFQSTFLPSKKSTNKSCSVHFLVNIYISHLRLSLLLELIFMSSEIPGGSSGVS